jgi:hypothetical protein
MYFWKSQKLKSPTNHKNPKNLTSDKSYESLNSNRSPKRHNYHTNYVV